MSTFHLNTIQKLNAADINRLALLSAIEIVKGYGKEHGHHCNWKTYFDWGEYCPLALAIRNILWEIKEYGQLKTRPEDLMDYAARNFRSYEYRLYPSYLTWCCRAFARQFADFTHLPNREFEPNKSPTWRIHETALPSAKQSDYSARTLMVERVFSHDEFGNQKKLLGYYLCEKIYGIFEYGTSDGKPDREFINNFYTVVPFDDAEEASFFLAQLVELLNTGKKTHWEAFQVTITPEDDYIHQAAAQLIRNTIAQAPVEEILIREEQEAKARAEQLERERIAREEVERIAKKQAERIAKSGNGFHCYIFQLSNNTIKIGFSNNVMRRAATIIGHSGLDIPKIAFSQNSYEDEARRLEKRCHEHFAPFRIRGEFFSATFEDAVNYLQSLCATPLEILDSLP